MSEPNVTLTEIEHLIGVYKIFMYTNGVVALLSNLLATYMILYKSPNQMKTYRWYLLNIQMWSGALDVYLCLFYQPFLFFPAVVVCARGILSYFTNHYVHVFLFQFHNWLMGGLGMAIASAFIYRYAAVVHSTGLMHKKSSLIVIILMHALFSSPVAVLSLYASLFDRKGAEADTKDRFPLVYEYIFNKGCMLASTKLAPISTIGFLVVAIAIFALSGALITSLIYIIMLRIKQEKFLMSSRTYAMEKQLLISLTIQFIVPTMSIALPFLLQINLIIFGDVDDRLGLQLGALFFIFATWHSTLNSLCMIALTKPYRRGFLDLTFNVFCCGKSISGIIFANDSSTHPAPTGRTSSFWLRRNLMAQRAGH